MSKRLALQSLAISAGVAAAIVFLGGPVAGNPFLNPAWELWNTIGRELDGEFLGRHMLATMKTGMLGYLLGASSGIVLGIVISLTNFLSQALYPILIWARATPSAAIVPVAIAMLGFYSSTIVFLVAATTMLNVAVTTGLALAQTNKSYLDVAQVYRFNPLKRLLVVRFGSNLKVVFIGLHAGLQSAIGVTLLAEALSSDTGLGAYILFSLRTFRLDNLWFALVVIGLMGLTFNAIFHFLESRVLGVSHG